MSNITACDLLEQIEQIQGTNAKVEFIKQNKDNQQLKDFFRLSEDPYIDFGIKKITDTFIDNASDKSEFDLITEYIKLLDEKLSTRKLTGNAARTAVVSLLSSMKSKISLKWCLRLLMRNLRCGVSSKLINKIWNDLNQPFKVLLATAVEVDKENIPIGLKFPVQCEPKLDGLRCIAIKHNGVTTLYTRNGTVLETLPSIKKSLDECEFDNFVLDSEGMASRIDLESWNDSASVLMSHKNKKDDSDISLNVFDFMTYEEWTAQKCNLKLSERIQKCMDFVKKINKSNIKFVNGEVLYSLKEVLEYSNECLESGYEGIMIKDLNGLYEWKRVKTSVMKYKPVETYDGIVVGHYTGGIGTKNEGIFGGIFVLCSNGAVTKVGGGFNESFRNEINNSDLDSIIGKVVEIKGARGLTTEGKIRFPEFKRWRDPSDVDPIIFDALEEFQKKTNLNV